MRKFEYIESEGYAWSTYDNHDHAVLAMKNLQVGLFHGAKLHVAFAEPRAYDDRLLQRVKSLEVKRLPEEITEEQVIDFFGGREVVETVELGGEDKEKPRGYATVHFTSRNHAERVLSQFNGRALEGRNILIEWHLPDVARKPLKPTTKRYRHTVDTPHARATTTTTNTGRGRGSPHVPRRDGLIASPYPIFDRESGNIYGRFVVLLF